MKKPEKEYKYAIEKEIEKEAWYTVPSFSDSYEVASHWDKKRRKSKAPSKYKVGDLVRVNKGYSIGVVTSVDITWIPEDRSKPRYFVTFQNPNAVNNWFAETELTPVE